jgi:hypothetical protein
MAAVSRLSEIYIPSCVEWIPVQPELWMNEINSNKHLDKFRVKNLVTSFQPKPYWNSACSVLVLECYTGVHKAGKSCESAGVTLYPFQWSISNITENRMLLWCRSYRITVDYHSRQWINPRSTEFKTYFTSKILYPKVIGKGPELGAWGVAALKMKQTLEVKAASITW